MRDYGRDLDIGTPAPDVLPIKIVDGGPVVTAVDQAKTEIETTAAEIRNNRRVNELILGQEVEE
ncbi:MAG: hypothetical protein PHU23_17740 [Dehalococcoidales bacterium]|nr:hypothetical protein [Dehalococcoidales bacterium]